MISYSISICYLQQVDDEFAKYLKQYEYKDLKLCGDNGKEEKFQVFFLNDSKLTTHFGIKWDHFCKINNFRIGQTIRFKLLISDNAKCRVYKVNPPASSSNPPV